MLVEIPRLAGLDDSVHHCRLTSVQFRARFAARIVVSSNEFNTAIFETVLVRKKPINNRPERWIKSDVITLHGNVQKAQISIVPTTEEFNSPELGGVVIKACCDGAFFFLLFLKSVGIFF